MQDNRKNHRYIQHLRAVIITQEDGKLVKTHGKTQDISISGASIISEYNLLSPHPVTVCLLINPGDALNPPVIFEAQSKIVSSVLSHQQGGFRLGIEFIKIEGDGQKVLKKFLGPTMTPST
jgi:hypothetical protein